MNPLRPLRSETKHTVGSTGGVGSTGCRWNQRPHTHPNAPDARDTQRTKAPRDSRVVTWTDSGQRRCITCTSLILSSFRAIQIWGGELWPVWVGAGRFKQPDTAKPTFHSPPWARPSARRVRPSAWAPPPHRPGTDREGAPSGARVASRWGGAELRWSNVSSKRFETVTKRLEVKSTMFKNG